MESIWIPRRTVLAAWSTKTPDPVAYIPTPSGQLCLCCDLGTDRLDSLAWLLLPVRAISSPRGCATCACPTAALGADRARVFLPCRNFRADVRPAVGLSAVLAGVSDVREAFVYGLCAARWHGEPGLALRDVDGVVVGDATRDALGAAGDEAPRRRHREVNITRVTQAVWWLLANLRTGSGGRPGNCASSRPCCCPSRADPVRAVESAGRPSSPAAGRRRGTGRSAQVSTRVARLKPGVPLPRLACRRSQGAPAVPTGSRSPLPRLSRHPRQTVARTRGTAHGR